METQDPLAALAITGWVSAGVLLLIVAICAGAKRGSLPLNNFVGLRIPALMRDEDSWQIGHAAALMPALISFALALGFDVIGVSSWPAYWGAIAVFIAGLVWIIARASRAASRTTAE
jgi:hypothetical protein